MKQHHPLPRLKEKRHPYLRVGAIVTPAAELERRAFTTYAELVDPVAGVDGVEVWIHPAAEEPRCVGAFGVEIECN